jgi:hypothetical protein
MGPIGHLVYRAKIDPMISRLHQYNRFWYQELGTTKLDFKNGLQETRPLATARNWASG